jgi:hypothetical protein
MLHLEPRPVWPGCGWGRHPILGRDLLSDTRAVALRLAQHTAIGLTAGAATGTLFSLSVLRSRSARVLESALVGAVTGALFAIGAGPQSIGAIWTAAVAATGASFYLLFLNFMTALKQLSGAPPDEEARPDDKTRSRDAEAPHG